MVAGRTDWRYNAAAARPPTTMGSETPLSARPQNGSVPMKVMHLRYAGTCPCGAELPAGAKAGWDTDRRTVVCATCLASQPSTKTTLPPSAVPEPTDMRAGPALRERAQADAGASLTREYDRRMAKRDERVRSRLPRLGPLLLAVFDESQSTKAFKQGAEGERRAVKRLLESSDDDVHFLVNRKLGHGRRDGDIDVIAVSSSGVWVVDVKRYADAKVRTEKRGGLFSQRTEHLLVRGRDADHLLAGIDKQVSAVTTALQADSTLSAVPVLPVLCFVDSELPIIGRAVVRGVRLLSPKGLSKSIRESHGPLGPEAVDHVVEWLDAALPLA